MASRDKNNRASLFPVTSALGRGMAPELLFLLLGASSILALFHVEDWQTGGPVLPLLLVLTAIVALGLLIMRRARNAALAIDHSSQLLQAANADLAHSRQRFRDFAEAASDWFWESDVRHNYTYRSERLAELLEGDPAALFGATLFDLEALVEDHDTWLEYRADIEAGQPFRDLEVTYQTSYGDTRVFRISGQPALDARGRFCGYRGTGIDITLETMALMDARFMQTVVHDALDSISEGFVLFSGDGELIFCNDRYRRAYPNLADRLLPGTSFEEILRTAAERGGFEGDPAGMEAWVEARMTRHLAHNRPVDGLLSDGCWYRISEHATGAGGIVKILMDITELKQREEELAGQTARLGVTVEALSESERRYRQLVELAPYGIILWDRQAIMFGNPAAAAILGVTAGHCLDGATLTEVLADEGKLEDRLRDACLDGMQMIEWEVRHPSGDARFVEIGAFPVSYQGESVVLLVLNDVTDRKRAEGELQRSQKMEAVGRMAGGIAHEFNNMLTAIGGFARLAERDPGNAERVTTCVREIAKASDRAAALTGQLLDFSRRRTSDETELVALAALVRDLRIFLKPLMSAGIDLTVAVADEDAHAVVNPVTLNQAILNLALNARDAMPDGGRLTVSLGIEVPDAAFFQRHDELKRGHYAVIRVTDEGEGVPENIRDRIWEPFFTTKEPGKGTGLGLWIVYGTAKQANGMAEMSARPEGGSVFSIWLPASAPPVEAEAEVDQLWIGEGETAAILLVDDEESVRSYLRLTLEEAGCQVTEAADGQEALERWHENAGLFDAVITDVSMPRLTGPELIRRLEEMNPGLRALMLTGYASKELAAGVVGQPGRQLLMKPVPPDKLLLALRELLGE